MEDGSGLGRELQHFGFKPGLFLGLLVNALNIACLLIKGGCLLLKLAFECLHGGGVFLIKLLMEGALITLALILINSEGCKAEPGG